MGITRDAVKNRLERLARRMRRCPIHGIKLRCPHEYFETHEWGGTPEELEEVADLIDRMKPYLVPCQPSGQVCPTCPGQEPLWCESCYEAHAIKAGPIFIPDEVMTQAQYDRYRELAKLMREKPLTPATPAPEPIASPEPTPPPVPLSLPAPVAPVPVALLPLPVPVAEDEEEVDAELVQLVAQLKARLSR